MRLILDTNELISAVAPNKNPSSIILLDLLADPACKHSVHLSRTIINELQHNLSSRLFSELFGILQSFASIDEDSIVPVELFSKYETMNLKPADALIGAYTEWVGADVLVSENRHFLRHADLPFRVLTAKGCLELLVK